MSNEQDLNTGEAGLNRQSTDRKWHSKKRYRALIGFFALCLVINPFLPEDEEDAEPQAQPTATQEETTTVPEPTPSPVPTLTPDPVEPEATLPPGVFQIEAEFAERILDGAEDGPLTYLRNAAYTTEEYGDPLTYIAIEFTYPSGDPLVGVWATGSPVGQSFVWSVDGFAQEFTVWPNGRPDFSPSVTDEASYTVKNALELTS
ncbi:hypothetical protein [Georgenia faecalis]|uniref:Uncharacterized protein n=1 Tax=Georgenia faecalis TaxID=2483799 RepID=A0ABV9D5Y9_9MICO|nr:hypothetical protein [Georgenia faecalis]